MSVKAGVFTDVATGPNPKELFQWLPFFTNVSR